MATIDKRQAILYDLDKVENKIDKVEERLENKIDKVEKKLENKIDKVANDVTEIKAEVGKINGKIDGFLKGQSISMITVAKVTGIITAIGVVFGLVVNHFK